GNGFADIMTANATGTVSVVLNEGGHVFAPAVNLAVGEQPRAVVTLDLDDDGDLDIALITDRAKGAAIQVLRNDVSKGQLVLADAQQLDPGGQPFLLTGADVDGDGVADLISVDAGPEARGGGGGHQANVSVVINDVQGRVVCQGNLNGDDGVDASDLAVLI